MSDGTTLAQYRADQRNLVIRDISITTSHHIQRRSGLWPSQLCASLAPSVLHLTISSGGAAVTAADEPCATSLPPSRALLTSSGLANPLSKYLSLLLPCSSFLCNLSFERLPSVGTHDGIVSTATTTAVHASGLVYKHGRSKPRWSLKNKAPECKRSRFWRELRAKQWICECGRLAAHGYAFTCTC